MNKYFEGPFVGRLKIITDAEGLRLGNLILVDNMVYPPSFICAELMRLGDNFESEFNNDTINCAYAPIGYKNLVDHLRKSNPDLMISESESGYTAEYNGQQTNVVFMHELQNWFKDLSGSDLKL